MNKLIPVISLLAVLMATAIFISQSDDSEATADPSTGTQIGDLYYTFSGTNATVVGYSSSINWTTFNTIPDTVTYNSTTYTVTNIGFQAFYQCTSLNLTSLPSGLTNVGTYAFTDCTSLDLTSLPSGLITIEGGAFSGCTNLALTSLPSGVTSIGNFAFSGCTNLALTSLPSGLMSIGSYAFSTCPNITLTSLPRGLTVIEERTFYSCTNLALTSLPSGLMSIGSYAFSYCTSLTGPLVIPEGVSTIGSATFSGCTGISNLIMIPSTMSSIGESAFSGVGSVTPIPVLYNLSSLNIVAGSQNYGEVAYNVTTVETSLPASPVITSTPTYVAQVGDSWSYTVVYTGTYPTLTTSQPSWITLSGDTLSGTNAPYGTYRIDITVTDVFGRTDMQSIDLTVTADYIVAIESNNTAYGTVDRDMVIVPYDTPYSVSGDKLTIGSTVITATPTPTVVGDQYSYSFSGWSVSSGTVTSNMPIVANFDQTVREYTVTINVNNPSYGTVNKNSVTVPYGSTMTVSGLGLYIGNTIVTPTATPATIDTNYWFGNWTFPPGNPSGSTITHDITVTANFYSGVRYYEITFVTLPDGYGTLDIDYPYSTSNGYRASYGSAISVSGNVLTIDGERDFTVTALSGAQEVDWTYSFDNWTVSSSTVTGDMTIYANFTRTANTVVEVTVSTPQGQFYEGGNAYTSHVFRVPIPSSVSQDRDTGTLYLWNYEITADMTVSDELYDYTFFIWDGVPVGGGSVSDGMTINAVYHSEDRYYEVNFSIADGFGTLTTERVLVLYNTLIYSENNVIVVGSNTITATPTPDGDGATYEFIRWDGLPMSGRILEDTDISAKIQRTVTANAFNIVEIEHGDVERVWSIPDEYLPLMLVIPVMLLIGMVILALNRKSDEDDYESY